MIFKMTFKPILLGMLLVGLSVPSVGRAASYPASDVVAPDQQGKNITGVVVDDKGESIIGANVTVKGTTNGTITDFDGRFTLTAPGNAVLVVSYVGYTTKEVPVNNQTQLNITLSENTQLLSEVVVVGYGSLDKKQVTSAITSIKAKDMMVGVGGSDISTALQGKIGGLVMNNLGGANSSTKFQLRGLTSINAGTSPLIVIDGFAGGDIRSLTQEDIESIDVLKDGSAGAIYGTRAASGVILITTKSGKNTNGKIKVSYSGEISHKQNYSQPEMLSADEYRAHNVGTDYGADTDWWKEMINTKNLTQKHHVTLEGGDEKMQVYSSFFYEKNEGIAMEDSREDFGGRVNLRYKMFDGWLELNPVIDYRQARRNNNNPDFQQALRNNPTRSPYDPNSDSGYNVWTDETMDYNTVADAALYDYNGTDKWFKPELNIKLNIKPIPGLNYQQIVGYENRQWDYHHYQSRYHRSSVSDNYGGYAELGYSQTQNLTSEGFFSYIHDFEGGHNLNATAGYSYYQTDAHSFSMSNKDFPVEGVGPWDIGAGNYLSDGKASMSSNRSVTERLFAVFARANYSYKDKYMLGASIRHEGSSKFAADNRWANFWAANAGWRISEEAFLKDVEWVNDLKVRFGYGVTGNNDFGATYSADLLSSDTYWKLPSGKWEKSYGTSQTVNRNLGWEEKKEWNVGVDFSFFNNRLRGKFDLYRRKIDNMIFSVAVPIPPSTHETMYKNIGEMESKGWEFEIGGDIIQNKNWMWTSNFNFSHNTGKILTLYGDNSYISGNGYVAPGSPGDAARIQAGSEIGQFYIYKWAGFDEQTGEFLLYDKDDQVIHASQKTSADRRFMGHYVPKLIVAWNNTVTYKNFDLGINMRSWIDFDVMNTINMYYGISGVNNLNVLKKAYTKYQHIVNQEKQVCDYYMEDGTFLKIDAITLGYTLPMQKYTKHINSIRAYATLGNVCTITGYTGMNPEVNITSWDQGTEKFWSNFYPMARTYTFGLQLNF